MKQKARMLLALALFALAQAEAVRVQSFQFAQCGGPGVGREPWNYIATVMTQSCLFTVQTSSAAVRLTQATLRYDLVLRGGKVWPAKWTDTWKAGRNDSLDSIWIERSGSRLRLLVDTSKPLSNVPPLQAVVVNAELRFSDGTVFRKSLRVPAE